MYLIFLAVISIGICYKSGDWRNWKKYYPTILFFILSNVVCILLTYNHALWQYKTKILNHTFSDLFISITVYPSMVMLFIPNFPKKTMKIITHISFYVALYTIAELIGMKLGYFIHFNGWNIWFSIIVNYILFSLLYLHYKKPIYAWIIALLSPHILFFFMNIPYNSIK
ncbi:MAG: CBO0543 family protein [Clostridium sp.]|uniref:CBO0543 family protein n=1 Tax=Clostridium sp. TaxID=1506 RepID=UPI003D6D1209